MAGTVAIQQPAAVESQPSGGVPGPTYQQKSALYVGELDASVNEGQLFEIFNQIGPVHSIRVCRDVVTRRSLGYAYVNYNASADPDAAGRAIEQLNYYEVSPGKPMRIMWSDRDPSQRRSGQGNVFIKNLDHSIDHKALHDTFAQFGKIQSCKIATDESGRPKGYGFVHFESAEAAKEAISKVNGKKLRNTVVFVGPFVKRSDRIQQHEKEFTNLYVKNLADEMTDETLKELFEKYGEISSAVVMKDENGASRKFGFVDYKRPDDAKRAIQEMHEYEYTAAGAAEPQKLYVQRAQKKSERQALLRQHYDSLRQQRIQQSNGMNVYVRNLAEAVDDEMLRNEFSSFGTITSAKVMRDDSNVSRGFGFVCFSTPEEASRAIQEKQNAMVHGKPLFVALAQPKEVRQQMSQQMQPGGMMQGRAPGGAPAMGPAFIPPGVMYPPMQAPPGQGMFFQQPMGPRPNGMGRTRGGRMQPGYGMTRPQGVMPPYQQPPGMGPGRMGPQQRPPRGRGGYPNRTPQRGNYPPNSYGPTYYAGGRGRGGQDSFRGRGARAPGRGAGREGGTSRQVTPPAGQAPPPAGAVAAGAPAGMAPVVAPTPGEAARSDVLDPKQLANLPPDEQKQMIGEKLFENIDQMLNRPSITGKVTGMLLEMDTNELLVLYDNPPYLKQKVDEALFVLKEAGMDAEAEAPAA